MRVKLVKYTCVTAKAKRLLAEPIWYDRVVVVSQVYYAGSRVAVLKNKRILPKEKVSEEQQLTSILISR